MNQPSVCICPFPALGFVKGHLSPALNWLRRVIPRTLFLPFQRQWDVWIGFIPGLSRFKVPSGGPSKTYRCWAKIKVVYVEYAAIAMALGSQLSFSDYFLVFKWNVYNDSESESRSVVTLWDPLGIFQARILERVSFPFSGGSSQPRDQTQVSSIAGKFFTGWATREALIMTVFIMKYKWNTLNELL